MELYLRQVPRPAHPRKAWYVLYHSYCPRGDHPPHSYGYYSSIYEAIGDIHRLQNARIVTNIIVSGIEVHYVCDIDARDEIGALGSLSWGI